MLTKQLFTAHFSFQPGETSTTFENHIGSTFIKLGRNHKVGEYLILAGLQLTHEQLDYDRKMGRYSHERAAGRTERDREGGVRG